MKMLKDSYLLNPIAIVAQFRVQDMQGRHTNNIYLFSDSIVQGMDSASSAE
uniref:Uncharacterized protein n=1 Tax=Chlorobium phaeobacteroides (strain BS1) TaxID=331678 RepID=B3EM71_CHLPB